MRPAVRGHRQRWDLRRGRGYRSRAGDPRLRSGYTRHGLVWRNGGSIQLHDYLADCCKPFADKFDYYVNETPCDGTLHFGPEPTEFHRRVFHVELRLADGGTVLDRMWVVVSARKAKDNFDDWFLSNHTNLEWVATLLRPYAQISLSTNILGWVSAVDPEPGEPNLWETPRRIPAPYLHHDSTWEMRSIPDAANHRNQACYNLNGILVEAGIAAGTADYSATLLGGMNGHVPQDVNPYLHSVHLDGNPGDTTIVNGLSQPCPYQGNNIDKYLQCRPTILP